MAEIEQINGADNGNQPDTLRQAYPKVNRNFTRVNNQLVGHIDSNAAHAAEKITYNGSAPGANVKQAIDGLDTRIDGIVAQAGDDNTEIVDARGGYTVLGDRLNASDAQLADISYNVKNFGAKGDNATDDTNAILATVSAASENGGTVYFPPGTYHVSGLISVPRNVTIEGAGVNSTLIVCISPLDKLFSINGKMKNIKINGNLMANKCVSLEEDYCLLQFVYCQYATYGIYNNGKDVHQILNCSSDNVTYGIYSANRFINCVIDAYIANNDTYGVYMTYSDQQPQGIFITNSLFFGCTHGIFSEKDVFFLVVANTIVDGSLQTCIYIGPAAGGTGADIIIRDCFLAAASRPIDINAEYNHILIEGCGIGNSQVSSGIVIQATETARSQMVTIRNNSIGNNFGGDIYVDSPNGCTIENNIFSHNSGLPNIVVAGNYSGNKPPVIVRGNTFFQANPVGTYNTKAYDNVGWSTKKDGTATILATQKSVVVEHGLNLVPNKVLITPQGNVGNVWVSDITTTQFTINSSVAPAGNIVVGWDARAD